MKPPTKTAGSKRPWQLTARLAIGALLIVTTVSPPILLDPIAPFPFVSDPASSYEWGPRFGGSLLSIDEEEGYLTNSSSTITPDPTEAAADTPEAYPDRCFADETRTPLRSCVYGPDDADLDVALIGDSQAAQWLPALEAIAQKEQWRIHTYFKSRCTLTTATIQAQGSRRDTYQACLTWNHDLNVELVGENRPDVVITSSAPQFIVSDGEPAPVRVRLDAWPRGLANAWGRLSNEGIPVVAIVGTPAAGIDVPGCVSQNLSSLQACAIDRASAVSIQPDVVLEAARGLPNVTVIDMNDLICPQTLCAPVIGGILVYRDDRHLTATYARSLARPLWDRLMSK